MAPSIPSDSWIRIHSLTMAQVLFDSLPHLVISNTKLPRVAMIQGSLKTCVSYSKFQAMIRTYIFRPRQGSNQEVRVESLRSDEICYDLGLVVDQILWRL